MRPDLLFHYATTSYTTLPKEVLVGLRNSVNYIRYVLEFVFSQIFSIILNRLEPTCPQLFRKWRGVICLFAHIIPFPNCVEILPVRILTNLLIAARVPNFHVDHPQIIVGIIIGIHSTYASDKKWNIYILEKFDVQCKYWDNRSFQYTMSDICECWRQTKSIDCKIGLLTKQWMKNVA